MLTKTAHHEGVCDNCGQPVIGYDCKFKPIHPGQKPFVAFLCRDCEDEVFDRRHSAMTRFVDSRNSPKSANAEPVKQ